MVRKHAIVLGICLIFLGMTNVSTDLIRDQYRIETSEKLETPQLVQETSELVPQGPMTMNIINNPSFETWDSGVQPEGWVAQSSAFMNTTTTYTPVSQGNYGGFVEGMGGSTAYASAYLRSSTTALSTPYIEPGLSLTFKWHVLANPDLQFASRVYLYIQTQNSTGNSRYFYYYLSHESAPFTNGTPFARYLLNDTLQQWHTFDRNLTEDFIAAFGASDLSSTHYVNNLWFYCVSPNGATGPIQCVFDDVALYNDTYSGWVRNGDFENGMSGGLSYWSTYESSPANVAQSTDSTHDTYSVNITHPASSIANGYARIYKIFSISGCPFAQGPGTNVIEFDWKYNDTVGAGQWQYSYFRVGLQNASNYYVYFFLGQGNDLIHFSNSSSEFYFALPGFGTRETWQRAEIDLYEVLNEIEIIGLRITEVRFEVSQAVSGAAIELLIDDFQMKTFPAGEPTFEYPSLISNPSPHLGWWSSFGEVTKTTDSHSGTYANNMTAANGQECIVYHNPLELELDIALLTDFWWRLDDIQAVGIAGANIELQFIDDLDNFRYIRYILAKSENWNPNNSTNYKYVFADGFNQTGIWTNFVRNLTKDIEDLYLTSADDWVLSGIQFYCSAAAGMRTSFLTDDVNFKDAVPPTFTAVTIESATVYNLDTNIRTVATDLRPGISEVLVNYTTDGGTSWDTVVSSFNVGGWFEAFIPAQPYDTTVQFYVIVTDGVGLQAIDDNGGLFYSYTVIDDVDPILTIDSPTHLSDVEGLVQIDVTAADPGSGIDWVEFTVDGYVSHSDSIAPYSYSWQTDSVPLGMYTIDVEASDVAGNSVTDSINVTIVDTMAPVNSEPSDIEFVVGTIGHYIVWDPEDPRPASFEVLVEDVVTNSGLWNSSSEKINISLDGLEVGVYNYTCVVYDDAGNSHADTVIVTVTSDSTTTTTTTTTTTPTTTSPTTTPTIPADGDPMLLLIVGAIAGGAILVIVLVVILKRKK